MIRFALRVLLLTLGISIGLKARAQTCTGSLGDPVINETLGHGETQLQVGPPLPYGTTTLQYTNSPCDEGGGSYGFPTYMIGCHAATWHHLNSDHTGDKYGYFMLINGPLGGGDVYDQKVDGSKLCPNTTYEFAAWIMNVLVLTDSTATWVLPDLTFSIETAGGKVLKTLEIGDIPETEQPVWNHYGTFFTTPSNGSDIVVRLIDNQTVDGNGNDFAVDDITFRPCGPVVEVGFNTLGNITPERLCQGGSAGYTFVASQKGYDHPVYQWQQKLNDGKGWTDIPGATDTVYSLTLNTPTAGLYNYRMGVTNGAAAALSCRIYSDSLVVSVNNIPTLHLAAKTSVCVGQSLQLGIDQGESYEWTGPDNFTSAEQSPIVTASASNVNDGVYTVKVTTQQCPAFASTTVAVYPNVTGAISNNVTICEGDTATLSAGNSQGATIFKWTPSTGLSNTDAASVHASPAKTTTYTVTIGNGACDSVTRAVVVTVLQKPIANAGAAKKITEGESVKLNGTAAGDSVGYYWTPAAYLDNANSLTPIASPIDNTTYTLHVQSNSSCGQDSSSVYVRVYKKVTVLNAFSPNNDGINDYWDIKQLNTYPECSVMVFNRYGQQVYQSTGYAKPWDGKYNGAPLPQGTYYYIIDLKNDTPKLAGWVLIVR